MWICGSSHKSLVLFSGCHHWYMPLLLTNLNILPAWPDKLSQPRVFFFFFFFCPCSSRRTIAHARKKEGQGTLSDLNYPTLTALSLLPRSAECMQSSSLKFIAHVVIIFDDTQGFLLLLLNLGQSLKRFCDCWQYRKCCTVVHNAIFIETYIWFYGGHMRQNKYLQLPQSSVFPNDWLYLSFNWLL